MNKLNDVSLLDIAPPPVARDTTAQGIAKAADALMHDTADLTLAILLLPNLDTLPEAVIDALAWQYHVDDYDQDTYTRAQKVALIRQSIDWHRRKGTPQIVEEVCSEVFASAKVREYWEYGGEPYHFKVEIDGEDITDAALLDKLKETIASVKNARSWLDDITFERSKSQTIYIGIPMNIHKSVTLTLQADA